MKAGCFIAPPKHFRRTCAVNAGKSYASSLLHYEEAIVKRTGYDQYSLLPLNVTSYPTERGRITIIKQCPLPGETPIRAPQR